MNGTDYELTPFRLLLDRVVSRARPHIREIFPTIGLPLVVMSVLLALIQNRWMSSLMSMESEPGRDFFVGFAAFMGVLFFLVVLYVLAYIALFAASMDAVAGEPVSMGRAWRFAMRGRTLWTVFLQGLAMVGAAMLCFFPALVVMPLLSLTLPVMVKEGRYGLQALKRSVQIVWWNGTGRTADSGFLQAAALFLVGYLIQNAVSVLVQLPLVILQQYWVLREATGGTPGDPTAMMAPLWLQVPTQILAALAAAVTWFYWSFGFSMLYFELERRRTAPDLRRAIEELTGSSAEDESASAEEPAKTSTDGPPEDPAGTTDNEDTADDTVDDAAT